MHPRLDTLADQIVAARFLEEPLEAALLGLSEGGEGLADLSSAHEERLRATYAEIAQAAETLAAEMSTNPEQYTERDVLTADLIRLTAASVALSLAVPRLEFTVTALYVSPLSGLIAVLPMLPLDTPERARDQLERLREIPRVLDQHVERLRQGRAAGLTPVARGVQSALAQIDTVLADADLSGLRRAGDGLPEGFASEQDRVLDDDVVPAIRRYRAVLETEALPTGRSDENSGLSWLPGGDEMYRAMIRVSTSTQRSAQDLHDAGLALFEQLNAEFAELGSEIWGTRDLAAIHERLRTDPALRYESSGEILSTAIEAVRRAEAAAPAWFGLIPTTACAVEPVPAALADGSPPAYYFTGALDGSRVGTYFINTTKPGERFRQQAEAVAFHEAVPGHHFQLTIAQEIEGNHLVHSVFGDVATAEGWGLYSERLADEMGLYSGALARLGMVSTDAWRAARLVLDTGLHALGWSRQAAIDWMTSHVPMSPVEVASEVDRYIAAPGQALSYMVGRLELESYRRRATERLGDGFDVRAFHDLVLSSGPVPLPALSAAVDRWIDARRDPR